MPLKPGRAFFDSASHQPCALEKQKGAKFLTFAPFLPMLTQHFYANTLIMGRTGYSFYVPDRYAYLNSVNAMEGAWLAMDSACTPSCCLTCSD